MTGSRLPFANLHRAEWLRLADAANRPVLAGTSVTVNATRSRLGARENLYSLHWQQP
jgi:hypothetical protein